jgi:hypothetical protein
MGAQITKDSIATRLDRTMLASGNEGGIIAATVARSTL